MLLVLLFFALDRAEEIHLLLLVRQDVDLELLEAVALLLGGFS